MIRTYLKQCNGEVLNEKVRELAYEKRFDILSIICTPQGQGQDPIYAIEVDTDGYADNTPSIPAVVLSNTSAA